MFRSTRFAAVTGRRVSLICFALALVAALILAAERAHGTSAPAPTGLSGEAVTTGLKITWEAPDTTETITGYEIQRRRGSADYTVLVDSTASTTLEYTDTSGEGVDSASSPDGSTTTGSEPSTGARPAARRAAIRPTP